MNILTNKIKTGTLGDLFIKEEDGIVYYLNNSWINTIDFPRDDNANIEWKKCKGIVFNFNCIDVKGRMKILDVNASKRGYIITIIYANSIKQITKNEFYHSSWLQKIVYPHGAFLYKLNQRVYDDKRDFIILDRKYDKRKRKNGFEYIHMYLIRCNKCGADLWIPVSSIKNDDYKCSCCNNKVLIKGINDVTTTDPWMIPYFQGGEKEASKYSHGSHKKIYPKCPYCNKVSTKEYSVDYIYRNNGFSCVCSDHIKYPEKILMSILDQLNVNYIRQLTCTTFDWTGRYMYDFYLYEYNAIIETHGNQHYSTSTFSFKGGRTYLEEIENDKNKEKLALRNNISSYIVLDCRKSNIKWIKESVMTSILPNMLNFSENDINWEKCEEFAMNSLMIEVIDYYNNTNKSPSQIAESFEIGYYAVKNYLQRGNQLGLCHYETYGDAKYVHCKPIRCIENGFEYLGVRECRDNSIKDFGVKFKETNIGKAAKTGKAYHGFHFEYIDKDEYLQKRLNTN